MSGDVEEVRTIIALLAVKINESPAALDPVSLSSAMNGLRNFKDNFIEVRALLSTLAEKINCMREKELQPKILSNVLYGFRQMSGECPECKQVLSALNSKMGTEYQLPTSLLSTLRLNTLSHTLSLTLSFTSTLPHYRCMIHRGGTFIFFHRARTRIERSAKHVC